MQESPRHVEKEVRVLNSHGFHMRPATEFVTEAGKYACQIQVINGPTVVDGKSAMDLMLLGAVHGTVLKLVADGDDAEAAVLALAKLFEERFHVE